MYYYYSYKRKFRDDVLIYVEEYNREENSVLIDFFDSNEYGLFNNILNISYSIEEPSMILIKNYTLKRIQENTIYAIKRETLYQLVENNVKIIKENNSLIIGYTLELNDSINEMFSSSVSLNSFEDDIYYNIYMYGQGKLSEIDIALKGKISAKIRNVGQGNWNELIVNDYVKIVYDAGASLSYNKDEIKYLNQNIITDYFKSNPILILSHWDKDHYHCLLGMNSDELSMFSKIICRNLVPNLTCRKLFNKFVLAVGSENVVSMNAEYRNCSRGVPRLIPYNLSNNAISIYNAQYHKNRNISGIVLLIRTRKSSIIFTGDSHYSQISNDILSSLNYKHNHYLVVPHHGGNAGRFIYNLPNKVKTMKALISVGYNSYGHPLQRNKDSLNSMGFKIKQTLLTNTDIVVNLS